jgi:hypothetical protein
MVQRGNSFDDPKKFDVVRPCGVDLRKIYERHVKSEILIDQ